MPAPRPGGEQVRAQPIPNISGGAAVGDQMAQLGNAGIQVSGQLIRAHEETQINQAKAEYLKRLDDLEGRYSKDTDFATVQQRFTQDHEKLREEVLAGRPDQKGGRQFSLSEEAHNRLDLSLQTHGAVVNRRIRNIAFAREADANVAGLETEGATLLRNASLAPSPVEREAQRNEYVKLVTSNANAGWITRQAAALRLEKFDGEIEKADVNKLVRENPAQAKLLLSDPNNFPRLDPTDRERAITAAEGAADTNAILRLGAQARFAPETASLTLDRLADPAHAERIHSTLIVPTESNGQVDAVSSKGALGVSQLMPGTARDMARKVGLSKVADLSDADLKTLLTSPEGKDLNLKLGRAYFTEMLTRYNGRVTLALAAYNAGPERADEWKKKAADQFGENFTPAQFASVVNYKETRDYIAKIYERGGSRMDGAGLSPNGLYRASEHIRSEINQAETVRKAAARDLAAGARAADDPAALFEAGFVVDDERLRNFERTQEQAAMTGDRSAAEALQKLQHWKAMAPFIREAYSMPPATLQAGVAQMEAVLASSPSVSLEQKQRLDAFKAVAQQIEKRKDTDPVSLGERAFNWQTVMLDHTAKVQDPALRDALATRGAQAVRSAEIYGGTVKPFKPAEAEAWKQRYSEMPDHERHEFLTTLAEAMPERSFRAALGQVGAGSIDVTAGLLARQRPELGREILHGATLLKSDGVKPKAEDLRSALASKVRGELYPRADMQEAVIDAALAIYAAERGANASLYDASDSGGIERSIERVTGRIVSRNGVRTPVYPGMNEADFDRALDFTPETLARVGGAIGRNGQQIDASTISSRGIVRALEPGSPFYAVGMRDRSERDGFAPVFDMSGAPLVVDVRTLTKLRGQQIPLETGPTP